MTTLTKKQAGQTPAHIDNIPEGLLSRGFCVSVILFAVAWLVIIGSSWTSGA